MRSQRKGCVLYTNKGTFVFEPFVITFHIKMKGVDKWFVYETD